MISLLIPVVILASLSLLVQASISMNLFFLQLVWLTIGASLFPIFTLFERAGIVRARWFAWGVYAMSIALMVIALLFAPEIRNTRSWLVLGPFQFQPVELAKLGLILVFAVFFSRRHVAIGRLKNIVASFIIFLIPTGLTLLQPDLGSATILFGIWAGFLLVSGLPRRWVIAFFVFLAIGAVLGWSFALADYQKARILGVIYPETNALGVNYSVNQAKIAIGSAGWWGKGFGQGTQTQLGFLTEPATDFVLAALIEEWGIVAGVVAIMSMLFLVIKILGRGLHALSNFDKFFALGVTITFGVQFMINAGSTVGLLPVVGVTFPFLSYGGSSLLVNFAMLSIINTIRSHA